MRGQKPFQLRSAFRQQFSILNLRICEAKEFKFSTTEKITKFLLRQLVLHNVPLLGDVAMQAERVVSAKIELNREKQSRSYSKPAMIAQQVLSLSHHQRKSTKRIDKEFRQSASSRQVGCWIFERKLPATFFARPKQFPAICVSIFHPVFAIKIHKENPRCISTKNFKNFRFLSKQNFAQKKKEMSWSKWEFQAIGFKRFVQLGAISANGCWLCDYAELANRVFSAKDRLSS